MNFLDNRKGEDNRIVIFSDTFLLYEPFGEYAKTYESDNYSARKL